MLQNTPPVIRGRQDDGAGRHEPGIVSARTGVRPRVLFLNGDTGGGGDRDIFVVLPATKRRVGDGGRVGTEMRRSFSFFMIVLTRRGPHQSHRVQPARGDPEPRRGSPQKLPQSSACGDRTRTRDDQQRGRRTGLGPRGG